MEKSLLHIKMCLLAAVCAAVSLPQCVSAEQMKTVLTKVTSIGSQKQNTSARPVNARGVEVIVIASGSRIEATKLIAGYRRFAELNRVATRNSGGGSLRVSISTP